MMQSIILQGKESCHYPKQRNSWKKRSDLPHSCPSMHHICVVSHPCAPADMARETGRHHCQADITPKTANDASFLPLILTLRTVISSSASAVVSSSSVLACWSWLSSAWRAVWRLLIWDSRSCRERVNSVTWRFISSFCSSFSSPIYTGRKEEKLSKKFIQ